VVRPGDTLGAEVTVEERKQTGDAGRGILTPLVKVVNQKVEAVLEYDVTVLMAR
jgi:acyl dehydratase